MNLEKRPVPRLPDALKTLAALPGDCNGAPGAKIRIWVAPAIPATGTLSITHPWNGICLGDRWISIDTTGNEFPTTLFTCDEFWARYRRRSGSASCWVHSPSNR